MKTNFLDFYPDYCNFIDEKGEKKETWYSRLEAMEGIAKLFCYQKINQKQHQQMLKQIYDSKLPMQAPPEFIISVVIGGLNDIISASSTSYEEFTKKFFEGGTGFYPCFCGEKHGVIRGKTHYCPDLISSTDMAEKCLSLLKNKNHIDDEEEAKIRKDFTEFFKVETEDKK